MVYMYPETIISERVSRQGSRLRLYIYNYLHHQLLLSISGDSSSGFLYPKNDIPASTLHFNLLNGPDHRSRLYVSNGRPRKIKVIQGWDNIADNEGS
jgi:hypothetical protein